MGYQAAIGAAADYTALAQRIKAQAYALGFDLCGITDLGPSRSFARFEHWLSLGREGEMSYLSRHGAQRRDRRLVHPGATSAIVVAMSYGGRQPAGPIARYARGDDYHDVLRDRLRALHAWLEREVGGAINARPYVDTGPILERDLAREAGLGWIGKNTNLINPRIGSHFFIGALFAELALPVDAPFEADRCGTCTRCITACPTQAIVAPHELDARLCVSYLTIEQRGDIPEPLRPMVGDLVYGCDICQDVCPWNLKFATDCRVPELAPREENVGPDPGAFLSEVQADYRRRTKRSAMKRAKRRGLARNAIVALGNRRRAADASGLAKMLSDDDPMVRRHAAWALGRIGTIDASVALETRAALESDADVLGALRDALSHRYA